MLTAKRVLLFTDCYPYSTFHETFLTEELRCASELTDLTIVLVPLRQRGEVAQPLPPRVEVDNRLMQLAQKPRLLLFVRTLLRAPFWHWLSEVLRCLLSGKTTPLVAFRRLVAAELVSDYIGSELWDGGVNVVLYSYWLSFSALGIALARDRYPVATQTFAFSRAHRYEIEDNLVGFPLRQFTFSLLDGVFCVSNAGVEHLKSLYPNHSHLFSLSRLGVRGAEVRPHREVCGMRFISCSGISSVKRVDQIARCMVRLAREHGAMPIEWHHYGDGPCRADVEAVLRMHTPENLFVTLHGYIDNADLIRIYGESEPAIFVNLSSSEGLPISIMEALSAGFPVIATDVGGNVEAVPPQAGVILPLEDAYEQFSALACLVWENYAVYSQNARLVFENRFMSERNYGAFYKEIVLRLEG